jgi:hypothetical protein
VANATKNTFTTPVDEQFKQLLNNASTQEYWEDFSSAALTAAVFEGVIRSGTPSRGSVPVESKPRVASKRAVEQPRDALGRFMSKTGDEAIPGSIAEQNVWDAVKQKPGWQVVEGRVSVRDASGQLRVYDGVAVSPSGKTIGLEVKSGTATKTAPQLTFDSTLNSSRSNSAFGVGQNKGIVVNRALEIKR